MRTIVLRSTLLLMSASIAGSINNCEDPNFHSLETLESSKLECGPAFKSRCRCLRTCYDDHYWYVVNCTNTGFHDTSPLAHLPNETQVRTTIDEQSPRSRRTINATSRFDPSRCSSSRGMTWKSCPGTCSAPWTACRS